jgi:hypothetical protein
LIAHWSGRYLWLIGSTNPGWTRKSVNLMPQAVDDHLRDRRAHIARWLAQHTEADTVTGICETWVRDLADSSREPHSRHDLPGLPPELSLVARLSDAGLRTDALRLSNF